MLLTEQQKDYLEWAHDLVSGTTEAEIDTQIDYLQSMVIAESIPLTHFYQILDVIDQLLLAIYDQPVSSDSNTLGSHYTWEQHQQLKNELRNPWTDQEILLASQILNGFIEKSISFLEGKITINERSFLIKRDYFSVDLYINESRVPLTPNEEKILYVLMLWRNSYVPQPLLAAELYGDTEKTNQLGVEVKKIRDKISKINSLHSTSPDQELIKSHSKSGYGIFTLEAATGYMAIYNYQGHTLEYHPHAFSLKFGSQIETLPNQHRQLVTLLLRSQGASIAEIYETLIDSRYDGTSEQGHQVSVRISQLRAFISKMILSESGEDTKIVKDLVKKELLLKEGNRYYLNSNV
ncbi:MAG TPA: helix-turn-helix domain-containing protein [Patescibacteria group bacterium]